MFRMGTSSAERVEDILQPKVDKNSSTNYRRGGKCNWLAERVGGEGYQCLRTVLDESMGARRLLSSCVCVYGGRVKSSHYGR
jgi:hypothetical protein